MDESCENCNNAEGVDGKEGKEAGVIELLREWDIIEPGRYRALATLIELPLRTLLTLVCVIDCTSSSAAEASSWL